MVDEKTNRVSRGRGPCRKDDAIILQNSQEDQHERKKEGYRITALDAKGVFACTLLYALARVM